MVSIFARTLIIYILLMITMKMMGKREIGELDVTELVGALLVSEIAAIPIDDPDLPLLNAIIPITFLLSLEILISFIKTKSNFIKKKIEGEPSYIIYKGKVKQDSLMKNRITINEFLAEMRSQGVCDINDIEYALVEQSGKISIIKKDSGIMAHTIILDGDYSATEEKENTGLKATANEVLKTKDISPDEVFLMTVNDNGGFNIIKREKKK